MLQNHIIIEADCLAGELILIYGLRSWGKDRSVDRTNSYRSQHCIKRCLVRLYANVLGWTLSTLSISHIMMNDNPGSVTCHTRKAYEWVMLRHRKQRVSFTIYRKRSINLPTDIYVDCFMHFSKNPVGQTYVKEDKVILFSFKKIHSKFPLPKSFVFYSWRNVLTHTYQNHVSDDIPQRNVYVKWRQSPERNWFHGKLSNWQLLVQSVMKILSKWQLFFQSPYRIQYIPINMHTVFALLCFVVVIHWLIFPYPSGLLHWHCGNLTIAPVPAKQSWWIWINMWIHYERLHNHNKAKHNKTVCIFLGIYCMLCNFIWGRHSQPPNVIKLLASLFVEIVFISYTMQLPFRCHQPWVDT